MMYRLLIITSLFCSSLAAAENLPSNPRLLFNHGAELVASGDLDKAVEVLNQVAVVRDKTIAAKALSLLGQIAVATAKDNVAANPAETPPEQRQIVLDQLASAEKYFSESLSLESNNDMRQCLETLRAWRNNMTHLWNEYDREQKRNTELQQRIQWLADWEKKLTEQVHPITEEVDSPLKFQTEYESSQDQKKLAEELAMLQNVPANDEKLKEQWTHMPAIQKIAEEAAELLSQHKSNEALPKQQQVLEYLQNLLNLQQNQQNQDQQNQKQEQQEQNQNNENQEPKNQEDQKQENKEQEKDQQEQQNQQPDEQKQDGKQQQEMNQPQSSAQERAEQKKEEDAKEKVARLLMQVRRKEQSAEKRREQLRAIKILAEPVEKDW